MPPYELDFNHVCSWLRSNHCVHLLYPVSIMFLSGLNWNHFCVCRRFTHCLHSGHFYRVSVHTQRVCLRSNHCWYPLYAVSTMFLPEHNFNHVCVCLRSNHGIQSTALRFNTCFCLYSISTMFASASVPTIVWISPRFNRGSIYTQFQPCLHIPPFQPHFHLHTPFQPFLHLPPFQPCLHLYARVQPCFASTSAPTIVCIYSTPFQPCFCLHSNSTIFHTSPFQPLLVSTPVSAMFPSILNFHHACICLRSTNVCIYLLYVLNFNHGCTGPGTGPSICSSSTTVCICSRSNHSLTSPSVSNPCSSDRVGGRPPRCSWLLWLP